MTLQTDFSRLGLFDQQVPRYTSYPTAPHFSTAVQTSQHSQWLAEIPAGSAVSMYLHIPFCRRLCWFCACRTQGVKSDKPVQSYLGTLHQEIKMVAKALPEGVTLSRLHWGGGTPTILPPADMTALAQTIATYLPFAKDAEFSVEIDPGEIDDARLDALAAAGMTRASIGVQDFDPIIQKTIGRTQSYDITAQAAVSLRSRGIQSLNMDVLYGLPFQDRDSIVKTTKQVLDLNPDRVALYGYAHVPWMARRQTMIPENHLPAGPARLDLSETARKMFEGAGYTGVGIDHFSKPTDGLAIARQSGHLRRNFQGYTDDRSDVLIGLGASAISKFPQGYVQNIAATAGYLGQIRAGNFASARGHVFSPEDAVRAAVIQSLMCQFSIDFNVLKNRFGQQAIDPLTAPLDVILDKYSAFTGFDAGNLTILPKGQPLTRLIAREFDGYSQSTTGHSKAI